MSDEQSTSLTTLQAAGYTVLYAITILVALTGNILLIFIIKRKPETRSLTGFLFVNMAVADLLVTLVVMPVSVAFLYTEGKWLLSGNLGQVSCISVYFGYHVTLAASILSLSIMSVDRYLAVVYPFSGFPTFRRAKVLTVVIWLSSMIFSIPIAVVWRAIDYGPGGTYCTPVFKNLGEFGMPVYYTYLFLLMYLIPLLVISSLYTLVGRALWRRNVPTGAEQRNEMTKRKVVRTLVIITAVFAFCWFPTQCYHFILAFYTGVHDKLPPYVMFLCFWSGHANSAVNPWLYMMLTEKFRKALRDVLRTTSGYSRFRSRTSRAQSSTRSTTVTTRVGNSLRGQRANHDQANGLLDPKQVEFCRETVL
ncbi:hypothetical protein OS493_027942 [Desmophyllum pertusum]|uniref:G-protein coupled receptors family 1 profile domain-containing protein n=1 Tax=Desmophyllum pertusum TaxID=174260 RepID=A0A9X0CJ63_9CNID|nr:hypothetical protein OS493_027942 [Desmophyllum pertusum]